MPGTVFCSRAGENLNLIQSSSKAQPLSYHRNKSHKATRRSPYLSLGNINN